MLDNIKIMGLLEKIRKKLTIYEFNKNSLVCLHCGKHLYYNSEKELQECGLWIFCQSCENLAGEMLKQEVKEEKDKDMLNILEKNENYIGIPGFLIILWILSVFLICISIFLI